MSNSFEDTFFSHQPSTETDPVEVEEQTTETPHEEVEDVTPEPEPQVEEPKIEEPTVQEEAREDHKMVPLTALHQERAKARTAVEEANTLRQQIASLQAQQQSRTLPDPYDDPQGFAAAQQQAITAQVQQQVAMQNLNYSRLRAVAKYGDDYMNEVAEWAGEHAKSDPTFEAKLFAQPDPAEWVIAQKKRNEDIQSFTNDREAFLRAEFERMGLTMAAPQTSVPVNTSPAKKLNGPASIVNAKSRDSVEPMKPADAFDAIFSKSKKE